MDEFQHVVASYHQRSTVVVGVEAHFLGVEEVAVDEEGDLVIGVVHQCEERHTAGLHAEVAHHTFGAGEGEFALVKAVFHVVDVHGETRVHDDKVVAVALVVAEEEVLAEGGTFATVELRSNLDGRCLGVLVVVERDAHALEGFVYLWLAYHELHICCVILFNVKHIARVR